MRPWRSTRSTAWRRPVPKGSDCRYPNRAGSTARCEGNADASIHAQGTVPGHLPRQGTTRSRPSDAPVRRCDAALKRRGFTAWIESDSGEFVPVEGAMKKPGEIVDEHRHVADFNSIPELIEHAKGEGASAILVAGQQVTLYFPRRDGRYDAAILWNQNGYWHAPSKSARSIVTRLPTGAESIGSHTQRVGRRAGEAKRRRTSPSITGALQLATELSKEVSGSAPKELPGGFRWSEKNEAAQFTTYSPEHSQKVVVVVSVFEDASVAVDYFSDEELSETDRYENIGHFMYETTADLPEMKKDIEWVWETVDGYAASWQDDEEGNPLEEVRARQTGMTPEQREIVVATLHHYGASLT